MNKQSKLWEEIVNSKGRAAREVVAAYVKAVTDEAKDVPFEELAQVDPGENLSRGEFIASKFITALAQQEWLDDDEELSEILSIAGQIDMDSANQYLWKKLFAEVAKL